jgi:integrase
MFLTVVGYHLPPLRVRTPLIFRAVAIPNLYSSDRADLIWTDAQMAVLLAVVSADVARVVQLAAWTGLRQGDLLKLKWTAVFNTHIELGTAKSKGRNEAVVPILPECRKLLKTIPRRGAIVLTNSRGQPWRSFGTEWNKALHKSGLKTTGLHFHDLRGTFATRIYLAGLDTETIAQVMGWSVEKVERIMERYIGRNANMQRLVRQISGAKKRTKAAKLPAKLFA